MRTLFVHLVIFFNLQAQVKTEGPQNVEPGELCKITVTGIESLNDPKIECFPKNSSWEAVRRLDGSPVVLFYTKEKGTYTFVVAGNKDNKTLLTVHTVVVGGNPGPVPPEPVPPGPQGRYTSRLRSFYMVSPDADSLIKLAEVYGSIAGQANTVTSYKDLETALAASVLRVVGPTALRPLRDEVAKILGEDLAKTNSVKYDPGKTSEVFTQLSLSLKALK